MTKLSYMLQNWKLIIHLLFRTYYFGVNNQWWSSFRSMFGLPLYKRFNLVTQYKLVAIRSSFGFISREEMKVLFPSFYNKIHKGEK